jgi:mRNA-degrading endonuclease RelE of RelBE toxin-antitoxin system
MKHFATPEFWAHYRQLPAEIRQLADKNFAILRKNPHHPSLRLKKLGIYWSARVGLRYRVLAKERPEGLVWFWIGRHDEYEQLIKQ